MWTAFAATAVTSSMFLTSLAPNLLAAGLMHSEVSIRITWVQWMLGFLPVGAILIATLPALVYLIYPPEVRSSPDVPGWRGPSWPGWVGLRSARACWDC